MHKNVIIYLLEHPKCCQRANWDAGCLLLNCAVFPWNNLTSSRIFSEPDVVTPQVTALQPPPFPVSARDKYILPQVIKSRSYLCSDSLCHKVQVSSGKQVECQAVLLPFPPAWPFRANSQLSQPEQATDCPNCSQQDQQFRASSECFPPFHPLLTTSNPGSAEHFFIRSCSFTQL